ncbi:MAG: adenine phosphoribosyltransferase [Myxococcales bacterium]|nr:adenine phosphoribosyltransferase [Myxococcales bacterium]
MSLPDTLRSLVRDVPDFPKPGIMFKDITPLLQNGGAFSAFSQHLADRYAEQAVTQIVGIESRGFIFGAGLATRMGMGLTLVRKPGKLPRKTASQQYALEYGVDELQIHFDALGPRDRVVIVDDVLATGGTAAAAIELVESTGATVVEAAFLMELTFLEGRAKMGDHAVYSVLQY